MITSLYTAVDFHRFHVHEAVRSIRIIAHVSPSNHVLTPNIYMSVATRSTHTRDERGREQDVFWSRTRRPSHSASDRTTTIGHRQCHNDRFTPTVGHPGHR